MEDLDIALAKLNINKELNEFYQIAQVLIEHCWHLGIEDDLVESFKDEFMKHGYNGIYNCLVQLNEGCIEDEDCEECSAILEDFTTG